VDTTFKFDIKLAVDAVRASIVAYESEGAGEGCRRRDERRSDDRSSKGDWWAKRLCGSPRARSDFSFAGSSCTTARV